MAGFEVPSFDQIDNRSGYGEIPRQSGAVNGEYGDGSFLLAQIRDKDPLIAHAIILNNWKAGNELGDNQLCADAEAAMATLVAEHPEVIRSLQ